MTILIRRVTSADQAAWSQLRMALWTDVSAAELAAEIEGCLHDPQFSAFVAEHDSHGLCGFVEAAIRPCDVNGALGRFGYLEGWYVSPDFRRQGIGRQLVAAAEDWARGKGCVEMHSDAVLENQLSQKSHRSLNYAECARLVHFRKRLD